MQTIEKLKYKDVKYELYIHQINDKFYFGTSCDGISCKGNPSHINRGWNTPAKAIKDREEAIDDFLSTTPKTYKELAKAIEDSLVWTGYEDCHVDEFIIKTIIENFLKAKK